MTMLIPKDIELCVEAHAKQLNLPVAILMGVVLTESSGRWTPTRYEPAYRYVWDCAKRSPFRKLTKEEAHSPTPPKDFPGQGMVSDSAEEWRNQRTSFGPMQIMGAVARELGFKNDLTTLGSHIGIKYGMQHFHNLYKRFYAKAGIDGVIEAYNRGSPDDSDKANPYAQKVLTFAAQYRIYVRS